MSTVELIQDIVTTLAGDKDLDEIKIRWEDERVISVQWKCSLDKSWHLAKVAKLQDGGWELLNLDGNARIF